VSVDPLESPAQADDETTYAQGRLPGRTYASRGFPINIRSSRDFGQPARFIYKVFDSSGDRQADLDGEEWHVTEPRGADTSSNRWWPAMPVGSKTSGYNECRRPTLRGRRRRASTSAETMPLGSSSC
jgi:hypothetical protein